jgi:hypothetical protein
MNGPGRLLLVFLLTALAGLRRGTFVPFCRRWRLKPAFIPGRIGPGLLSFPA